MSPKTAAISFACALLAGGLAFGASGEYQQTRDGKTTVWNGSPKAGESASWEGARDKQGYATGFGTITWYNANGTVYGTYYGNMVNGKLEGPVNAHTGRHTAHAYFADGGRATAWARGPAPSKMNVPEDLVAKRLKAESEPPKPREERAESKKEKAEKAAETSEIARPTETPKKPVVAAAKPKPTPAPTPVQETIPTPEPSVAPTSPPEIAETTTTLPTPEPTQSTSSSLFETTPIPKVAETPTSSFTEETPRPPTPEPSVERTPEPVAQSSTPEPVQRPRGNTSLNALVGPPSSLREPIPEANGSSKPTSSGTRGIAQLSEDDAIAVADAEAREKGYNLDDYQRPKADYSAVKDKWSLFYNLKDPKAAGGDLQPFSVTVDDKTKKVEVRKNY